MNTVLFNKQEIRNIRKELRNHLTPAEAALWSYLKIVNLKAKNLEDKQV